MSITARASDYGDTAASVAVKNCGGNSSLERHRAWVVLGFMELVTERARYRILVLRDLVLYTGHVVGVVDGVRVMCLVQLRVRVAMGSFTVVLSLVVVGEGLVNVSSTLGDGVVSIGTLGVYGMSDGVCGGGIGSGFGTLGDVCSFLRSVICVKIVVVQWELLCGRLAHEV